jgi:hypothetical protein
LKNAETPVIVLFLALSQEPFLKSSSLVCLFFSIAFSIAAASQTSSEPVAKQQTPQDVLQAMVGQKLFLLQFAASALLRRSRSASSSAIIEAVSMFGCSLFG